MQTFYKERFNLYWLVTDLRLPKLKVQAACRLNVLYNQDLHETLILVCYDNKDPISDQSLCFSPIDLISQCSSVILELYTCPLWHFTGCCFKMLINHLFEYYHVKNLTAVGFSYIIPVIKDRATDRSANCWVDVCSILHISPCFAFHKIEILS